MCEVHACVLMLCAGWYIHVVSGCYSCTVIVLFRFSEIVLCIATNYNAHVLMTFAIIRLIIMLLLRLEKLCLGLTLSGTGTQHLICLLTRKMLNHPGVSLREIAYGMLTQTCCCCCYDSINVIWNRNTTLNMFISMLI